MDNGEHDEIAYTDAEELYLYGAYRAIVNYDIITTEEVNLCGTCEGVRMGELAAVRHTENALINPTVTAVDKSVIFLCTQESTVYLEYTSGEGAYIYDRFGNSRRLWRLREK